MPRNRLEELRREHGWSQADLGLKLAPPVNASTVSKWESGTHGIPDPRKEELASLFGGSVAELMGWTLPGEDA